MLGTSSDDVLGIAEVRDVFQIAPPDRPGTTVEAIMRPVVVVAESRKLDGVMADMTTAGSRLCVVVDEHGGTAGILTREDIAEELVGDIADEFDEPAMLTPRRRGRAIVLSGTTTLDELEEATGLAAPEGPYETLAGFTLQCFGEIPPIGAVAEWDGWRLQITDRDRLRIAGVLVKAPEPDGVEGLGLGGQTS
ncbi:transporter associated domain-containing protein [Candidatus Poriferisodalis sp.]|uniref:transporter associated domain-containing protein n=1 Tax=Candidatus Poriferisodalis sp. TaxID=3101277 RepID=UPI003D0CC7FD